MDTTFYKSFGYGIILLGCTLSFVSSFTPQLALGYYLEFGVLLAGLLPYLVYSMAVALYESLLTIFYGMALIAVHAWLVINVRFIEGSTYTDVILYFGPIILTVALIPLLIMALRVPYR